MFYFLEFSCLKIESWLFLFCVFSDIFSFSCSLYVTYYCGCPFLVKICWIGCWLICTRSPPAAAFEKWNWIRSASGLLRPWEDIPSELIKKSFRKCCITNALDGTEDDEMWDEDDDDSDPFTGINDDDDDADLHYADSYEREQADIDPEGYQNLFGDSDSEDFNGF